MLPLHGDPYTSPSYGHVHAPPPPLRHNSRGQQHALTPAAGPIITELTPSEYGSTVTDVRRSSFEREQRNYVRRLGHQRFYSPEQNSESPRATKPRSWREVNDDVAARVTAASSDSPPIIPRRDYDDSTLCAGRGRAEAGQKPKRTMKTEPKESTPIVTYNNSTMNRAVQLYKSPNKNGELVAVQNTENEPLFQFPLGQPPYIEGMPFPPMFPYFLLPSVPPPFGCAPPPPPPPPIVFGSPVDVEMLSYGEAQRQNQLAKKCASAGYFAEGNMFPPPPPLPPPPTFLPDPLCQPSAPHSANGFMTKPTGRYHYDPIGPSFPVKEKRKDKSDPCLLFCCKDFTQLVWLIVGIILIGLVIGLILGLTLV